MKGAASIRQSDSDRVVGDESWKTESDNQGGFTIYTGQSADEEDPFGDPLQEWLDIRNNIRAERFFKWATPNKK